MQYGVWLDPRGLDASLKPPVTFKCTNIFTLEVNLTPAFKTSRKLLEFIFIYSFPCLSVTLCLFVDYPN